MKLGDNFSFLLNRGIKVKIVFVAILFISVIIVLLDTVSIFSLLSIVSFVTDTINLQDKFSNLKYLPQSIINIAGSLDFKSILLILILILKLRVYF